MGIWVTSEGYFTSFVWREISFLKLETEEVKHYATTYKGSCISQVNTDEIGNSLESSLL